MLQSYITTMDMNSKLPRSGTSAMLSSEAIPQSDAQSDHRSILFFDSG
jgi:hypothetical protein